MLGSIAWPAGIVHDLALQLALLVIVACCVGLTWFPCGHDECREAHRRCVERDREAERRNQHDNWHKNDPDPVCPFCPKA